MGATWQSAANTLVGDLQHIFGSRLRSVIAYGSRLDGDDDDALTCMALVDAVEVRDLDSCERRSSHWAKHGLATPLILPVNEFRRSFDAFPLEYGEMTRLHHLVFGSNPFEGVAISREDLRRACETQVKGHLVH